ncbi:MAG: GNAT family N-acetyltransferase [Proteocatella sp.]
MEINIKKFKDLKLDELYEILRARVEIFILEQRHLNQELDYKDMKSHHFFVKDDEHIIAYLRILDRGVSFDEVSIDKLLVDKEYRGNALARKLMISAISFIESNMNESKIKIEPPAYLKNFYEDLGFIQVSDVYTKNNMAYIKMVHSVTGKI